MSDAKQPPKVSQAPMRDQVMPAYSYPAANAGSTVTVRRDATQKVSVLVNGVFAY